MFFFLFMAKLCYGGFKIWHEVLCRLSRVLYLYLRAVSVSGVLFEHWFNDSSQLRMIHTEKEEEEVCTGTNVFIVTGDRADMHFN